MHKTSREVGHSFSLILKQKLYNAISYSSDIERLCCVTWEPSVGFDEGYLTRESWNCPNLYNCGSFSVSTAQRSAAAFLSGSELHSPAALDVNQYLNKRWKQQGADSWGAGERATAIGLTLYQPSYEHNKDYNQIRAEMKYSVYGISKCMSAGEKVCVGVVNAPKKQHKQICRRD